MSIKLGAISVDLTANTVSFSTEMNKMSQLSLNTSKNIQRSLTLISGAATAMAASVTASLTAAIVKAEDFAFSMAKAAEITGTSSEMFSKLAYAAKLSGTPVDVVRTAMERLSKTSYAAQSGNKESIAAYAALGISVKDLTGPLKDSGDLFVAVSKSLDKFRDSTSKTGLEQKLLGRSGAELAPLLKQIATGFDTASQQATLFGVVIGDKTAAQAKRLHESMEQLESVALGVSLRLLEGVAPALEDVAGKVLKFVTSADGMKRVGEIAHDVAGVVYGLGNAFQFLSEHGTAVKRTLEGIALLQVASIFLPMMSSAVKANMALDSIGLTAVKMVGRMSGISALLPVLTSVTAAIQLQAFMVAGLYREEGLLTAATYAMNEAFSATKVALLANPITAVLVLLSAVSVAFYKVSEAAMQSEVDGGRWADVWHAGILGAKEDLNDLKKVMDLFTGDFADFASRKWEWTGFDGLVQKAGQARRGVSDNEYRMIHAGDLQPTDKPAAATKPDAPALPKETPDKVDHLKLKVEELAAASKAAHQSLLDAGKGVDFERSSKITTEYLKLIAELDPLLKKLTGTQRAAAEANILLSVTGQVNDEAQARYKDELAKTTQGLLSQANAQDILTQAVGKSADAVRSAAIAANAAKRDAGQSEQWKRLNSDMRAKDDAAFGHSYDRNNANADAQSLATVQDQISAQLRLNNAIVQGKQAKQDAALAEEQDAIRKRFNDKGDTNQSQLAAELAANERLFNLKQQEADLSKAASMNPARVYAEQAKDLADVAYAAKQAGLAIDSMQMAAANKQAWQSYLDSIDKTTLAVGSASQGAGVFFSQMARNTESAAEQVHTVLEGAFNTLNETLVKLVEGQKVNFSSFFRGISEGLAKLAIQKTESAIVGGVMGALGKGGKTPNPTIALQTKTNTYLAQILATLRTAAPGASSGISGSVAGATAAGGDAGNVAGSGMGALVPFASLIPGMSPLGGFGGHFALGGDVTAGMSYDVGEMGRETFTPTQNGKITPNNKLGGGSPVVHVDARGSNDPAQTEAAVHRAMRAYGPAMLKAASTQASEAKMRSPHR